MADSDSISFFNNIAKLTSFERKRKIYDLTNELDIYLLYDLIYEFNEYFLLKIQEIHRSINALNETSPFFEPDEIQYVNSNNISEIHDNIFEDVDNEKKRFNKLINNFLEHYEYHKIEGIIEETSGLSEDLNLLILRAKKLPKNLVNINNKIDEEILDYSDTSITSKIIFLEKLGILDFLRNRQPFTSSINKLAIVISAFTGANSSTLQSMLNPMYSNSVNEKNNPMNSIKTVQIVEKKLNQIGL